MDGEEELCLHDLDRRFCAVCREYRLEPPLRLVHPSVYEELMWSEARK